MNENLVAEKFDKSYGYVLEAPLLAEIKQIGIPRKIAQGEQMMDIGDTISHMPLVVDGAIKILREDENGDDLLLYFIEKGDTCAMSFACCMGDHKSEIRAVAENDTYLYMIPAGQMETWMGKYPSWRRYILDSYHTRMMELMETVDNLAFLNMDQRLLKYLQDKAKVTHTDEIQTTHQAIAYDLHTSRVVVSRLLKQLEREGKIEMQRNMIKILDL